MTTTFDPWEPRGTPQDLEECLKILSPFPDGPTEGRLGRKAAEQEIQRLARALNANLHAEDQAPTLGAAMDALEEIAKAAQTLYQAMTAPHATGAWVLLRQFQTPEHDSAEQALWEAARAYELPWGGGFVGQGPFKPGAWVPEIQALSEWLKISNSKVETSLKRQGRGSFITRLIGSVNEEHVYRCAILLEACNKPHGSTKNGHLQRLAAATKAFATNLIVSQGAMEREARNVCRTTTPEEFRARASLLLQAEAEHGSA